MSSTIHTVVTALVYSTVLVLAVRVINHLVRAAVWRRVKRRADSLIIFMRDGKMRSEANSDAKAYESAVHAMFAKLLTHQDSIPRFSPTYAQIREQLDWSMVIERLLYDPENVDLQRF